MANLNSLKGRIGVVSNTKKITKAMQLVATAKLQKSRKEIQNIKAYRDLIVETFSELTKNISRRDFESVFTLNYNQTKDLYIVISSDLGLCGAYNSNVYAQMQKHIQPDDLFIFVGAKAYVYWHNKVASEQIVQKYLSFGDKFTYALSESISKDALELYFANKIRSIKIIYTEFVNNITQDARIVTLFPFDLPEKAIENNLKAEVEFLPNAEIILRNSIPLYISSMIYALGSSSKMSEMASRRNAMENATDNAEELIKDLGLEYNRKRQSLITQEITEIVSGADATN
ncbi:ATP synthase F1 subunit gamma [Mycoplasmopsis sturni]|uniref:ATP synthase F1 subunit gamma n=1 Tax=Mycoplasmopsis sturni TaxID=39047 RepID=UPI0005642F0B|nr:ATP synthase F1 subunit gamma [Mycoplasmopsis sturni]